MDFLNVAVYFFCMLSATAFDPEITPPRVIPTDSRTENEIEIKVSECYASTSFAPSVVNSINSTKCDSVRSSWTGENRTVTKGGHISTVYISQQKTDGLISYPIPLKAAYYRGRSICFGYEFHTIRVYELKTGDIKSRRISVTQQCQHAFEPFSILFYQKYNCTGIPQEDGIKGCQILEWVKFKGYVIPKSGRNDKEKACNIIGDVEGGQTQQVMVDVWKCQRQNQTNEITVTCDSNPVNQSVSLHRNNGQELLNVLTDYPVMVEFFGSKICVALQRYTKDNNLNIEGRKFCKTGDRCCEETCHDCHGGRVTAGALGNTGVLRCSV